MNVTIAGQHQSRGVSWKVGVALTALFALFIAMDIAMKLARAPIVEQTQRQLGLPPGSGFWIGLLEAVILALYLLRRTSILGAIFVAALMGGTCAVQLVAGEPVFSHMLFGPYLAVVAWAGLWLRSPTLRVLLPLRRDDANG